MPSKSIHVAAGSKILFFFMAEKHSIVYMIGWFLILAIVNNAALNTEEHIPFQISEVFKKIYTQEWNKKHLFLILTSALL